LPMDARSRAIAKRALMRDLMRRVARISAECGNEEELQTDGGDADDFTMLSRKIMSEVEAIKKECRAKTRVSGSSSVQEGVALSHEIRRKRVALGEDLDKMKAMMVEMEGELEKKRAKAKGKPKRMAEVNRLETLQTQRKLTDADTQDTVAKLDMLINKVLQVASEADERRMQAASRPTRHQKLKLMDGAMKPDGTFERPQAQPQEQMDDETASLFQQIDAKNTKIMAAVDGISKQVKSLKQQALAMGQELQAQNIMLDSVEQKMDHMEGELATLTVKIGKFSKQVRGSNMFLCVCCILILLALVGYIISMVIPGLIPQ
jgi:archaellum component FlaC